MPFACRPGHWQLLGHKKDGLVHCKILLDQVSITDRRDAVHSASSLDRLTFPHSEIKLRTRLFDVNLDQILCAATANQQRQTNPETSELVYIERCCNR